MKVRSKILSALVIFTFMITAMSCSISADDADADSATAIMNETLYFTDPTSSASSVQKINDAAATTVCEYADNCLTFTKSVDLYLASSYSKNGFLVFNSAESQTIKVSEGAEVFIFYTGTASVSSDGLGTIVKSGSGDLWLSGSGELYVSSNVPNAYAVTSSNNVHFQGKSYLISDGTSKGGLLCCNLYCEADSYTYIESNTDGVVMTGSEITIDHCTFKSYGSYYGVKCSNIHKITVKSCTADIAGSTRAFSKSPSSSYLSLCNVYGSNNVSSESNRTSIELNEIDDYKHVMITSQNVQGITNIIWIIIPIIIFAVVAIAMILIFNRKSLRRHKEIKRSVMQSAADQYSAESAYETKVQSEKAYSAPEQTSYGGRTELMTQSLVEGTTFALIVDGPIVGYIGPQMSFISVPQGMHEIVIITNDSDRKTVYRKNHIVRQGMRITVSKKVGGYKVDIQ